jgi:hypothetical protein
MQPLSKQRGIMAQAQNSNPAPEILATMLPKLPPDRELVIDGMSDDERATLAAMIDYYGPDIVTDDDRWKGFCEELAYARNF